MKIIKKIYFLLKNGAHIIINNFDIEERKKYNENIEKYKKIFLHDDYLNILSNEDKKNGKRIV